MYISIVFAKQTKHVLQYKNIKTVLYKNNAAIWYNKTCRIKLLTPTYISIKVNRHKQRSQKNEECCHLLQNKPRDQVPVC